MSLLSRSLGQTGVEIPILGYGAMELRGPDQLAGPSIEDRAAGRLLNEALDLGLSLIDTSIDYGPAEEIIGRHLSSRRDEYFLASKCGCPLSMPPNTMPTPETHDYGPANIRAGVEQSLKRLKTDHLDLVQVHVSPARELMEAAGTVDELLRLRNESKVRFIGMSGAMPNLPDQIDMGVFDVFQIPYSVLQPEHDELITRVGVQGAGVLVRGSTARGTTTEGKNWGTVPINSSGPAPKDRWVAAKLDELLEQGMTRHEFVLRFTISHPQVSCALVGTSTREHLRSNAAIAARGALPSDIYAEARRRLQLADEV